MWEKWEIIEKPVIKEREGWIMVSLSTSVPQYMYLYSQAREFAKFLRDKLKHRLTALYYSSALSPECRIDEGGLTRLLRCEIYQFSDNPNIFLLSGDSSPFTRNYEFARSILSFAKELNITKLISIGTRWAEEPAFEEEPKVLGFASSIKEVQLLRDNGVKIQSDEPAPYFSNLIVGLAALYGIDGYKLSVNHGEPIPHPASVKALVKTVSGLLRIQVDVEELEAKAKEMREKMAKAGRPEMISEQRPPSDRIYG